jgi:cell division protein FtsN
MRMNREQRGGFLVGVLVGVLAGMLVSLAIAIYVTKMPVPFVNKVPQRSPAADQAEAERNRSWDPNAPLAGAKGNGKAGGAAAGTTPAAVAPASAPTSARDPAAILAGKTPPAADNTPIAGAVSALPQADPFLYFVQAGAYAKSDDADQQRARLAMMGVTAKVIEREQSGRTVYRVRVGPYEKKDEAEAMRDRLKNEGVDSALVRVNK